MNYSEREINNAKRKTTAELEMVDKAMALCDEVIKVVKSFDGKVSNKRFDTALKKVNSKLSYNINYNSFNIIFYDFDNRCIYLEDYKGEKQVCYIDGEIYMCSAVIKSSKEISVLNEDNRLIADVIVQEIERLREYNKNRSQVIREQLKDIESIIAQYQKIKEEMKSFKNNIEYKIRINFEFKF